MNSRQRRMVRESRTLSSTEERLIEAVVRVKWIQQKLKDYFGFYLLLDHNVRITITFIVTLSTGLGLLLTTLDVAANGFSDYLISASSSASLFWGAIWGIGCGVSIWFLLSLRLVHLTFTSLKPSS